MSPLTNGKGDFTLYMDNITYDKPFKTYQEQLTLLKSRNVIIDNEDFAINVLSSFSYYTIINGYKNSFISNTGSDQFVDGIKFEELYTLHLLDSALSNILFKYILHVERFLKTRLTYRISQQYGVQTSKTKGEPHNDYLNENHYSKTNSKRWNITEKVRKALNNNYDNEIINHYYDTKNHIPPWILATNLTFGVTIQWYTILTALDKDYVSDEFLKMYNLPTIDQKELFIKSISLMRDFRNEIAHGKRAFNAKTSNHLPKNQLLIAFPELITSNEYRRQYGQNDFYAAIISIMILINDNYVLNSFKSDLYNTIAPYESILFAGKDIYETLNIPNDIFQRLENNIAKSICNI